MDNMKNKVAIITGAARVSAEKLLKFGKSGANVVVSDVNRQKEKWLPEIKRRRKSHFIQTDVSDENSGGAGQRRS